MALTPGLPPDVEARIMAHPKSPRPGIGSHKETNEPVAGKTEPYIVCWTPPASLAAACGVTLDVYALAALGKSEYGDDRPHLFTAAMEVIRNAAGGAPDKRAADGAIFKKLTTSPYKSYERFNGFFGEQHSRKASTRNAPTLRHIEAAKAVIAGETALMPAGATSWFQPEISDEGWQGHRKIDDAATIVNRWYDDGEQWVGPRPGFNAYTLMAFTRKGGVSRAEALAAIEEGRHGRISAAPSAPAPSAAEPMSVWNKLFMGFAAGALVLGGVAAASKGGA